MSKQRILIVEDEPNFASALTRILQHDGFEVTHAFNGVDALPIVMKNMPDLVLCDINMPLGNGYKFCTEFRKIPEANNIPFVFLTSYSTPDDVRNGMNLGADDYLKKPCGRKELLDTINTRLKRKTDLEHQVNELVEKYTEEIKKRDETLGEIAQNQSHVVRAPLAALMQVISMIDMKDLNENNLQLVRLLGGLSNQLDTVIRENVYNVNSLV